MCGSDGGCGCITCVRVGVWTWMGVVGVVGVDESKVKMRKKLTGRRCANALHADALHLRTVVACKKKDKKKGKEKKNILPGSHMLVCRHRWWWYMDAGGCRCACQRMRWLADTLWMGLMQIEAHGFDVDALWMGLMWMHCGWV